MSVDLAANVLAGLIFGLAVYAAYIRVKTGSWPKIQSPFK